MPKLNIYVSNDLKREMDKHPDQHWSVIAQAAFRKTLHDLHAGKRGITYMDEKDFVEFVRMALDSLEFGRKERAAKRRVKVVKTLTDDELESEINRYKERLKNAET